MSFAWLDYVNYLIRERGTTMKTRYSAGAVLLALFGFALLAPVAPVQAAEEVSAIARGGKLYDKWWAENGTAKPEGMHAAYPIKDGKYANHNSFRCKECHGWDYRGKDGAYKSGSHASGIKGVSAMAGKDPAAIEAILKDKNHAFTDAQLSAADRRDLALFVAKGQVDYSPYYEGKVAKGNAGQGEAYFNTICAGCHGQDGKKVKDAPPLGSVAGNVPEMLHKILNGQPNESMPALRALDVKIAVDLAAYLQTLPKE